MKRYSPQSDSLDEQAKYQILLEDYLKLQKDFVSKKRRLQQKKQDRLTLMAEVRFLRRRHEELTMLESQKSQLGEDSVQTPTPCIKSKMLWNNKMSDEASIAAIARGLGSKKGAAAAGDLLKVQKKRKAGSLISGKRIGKKKTPSESSVALKECFS